MVCSFVCSFFVFLKAMKSPYPDEIKIGNHVPLKVGFDGTEKKVGVWSTQMLQEWYDTRDMIVING